MIIMFIKMCDFYDMLIEYVVIKTGIVLTNIFFIKILHYFYKKKFLKYIKILNAIIYTINMLLFIISFVGNMIPVQNGNYLLNLTNMIFLCIQGIIFVKVNKQTSIRRFIFICIINTIISFVLVSVFIYKNIDCIFYIDLRIITLACFSSFFIIPTIYISLFEHIDKTELYLMNMKHVSDTNLLKDDCPICLVNFYEEDFSVILTKCNHMFHHKCIFESIKHKTTCPICREEIINTYNFECI